jgi:pimeloyl-ACP methyl ester carboxylesterase
LIEAKLQNGDLVGTFRAPSTQGPFPGVLALGGSDGGTPEYFLNLLVPEGFACLAVAYWGTRDTQPTMVEIPLERLERGLRWLIDRGDVVAPDGRLAVVGASRGGELALLLAASFPDLVGPVVAYTPSSVVWFGLDFTQPVGATRSTWTHHGKPLPHLSFPAGVMPAQSERGLSMLPLSEAALADRDGVDRSAIAVERAHGPLLLVSGGDDRVWATERMCEMIVGRMSKHGRSGDVKHLHFPRAGHMLFPYLHPSDTMFAAYPLDHGGSATADAAAHGAAWGQVVDHLRRASAQSGG